MFVGCCLGIRWVVICFCHIADIFKGKNADMLMEKCKIKIENKKNNSKIIFRSIIFII